MVCGLPREGESRKRRNEERWVGIWGEGDGGRVWGWVGLGWLGHGAGSGKGGRVADRREYSVLRWSMRAGYVEDQRGEKSRAAP